MSSSSDINSHNIPHKSKTKKASKVKQNFKRTEDSPDKVSYKNVMQNQCIRDDSKDTKNERLLNDLKKKSQLNKENKLDAINNNQTLQDSKKPNEGIWETYSINTSYSPITIRNSLIKEIENWRAYENKFVIQKQIEDKSNLQIKTMLERTDAMYRIISKYGQKLDNKTPRIRGLCDIGFSQKSDNKARYQTDNNANRCTRSISAYHRNINLYEEAHINVNDMTRTNRSTMEYHMEFPYLEKDFVQKHFSNIPLKSHFTSYKHASVVPITNVDDTAPYDQKRRARNIIDGQRSKADQTGQREYNAFLAEAMDNVAKMGRRETGGISLTTPHPIMYMPKTRSSTYSKKQAKDCRETDSNEKAEMINSKEIDKKTQREQNNKTKRHSTKQISPEGYQDTKSLKGECSKENTFKVAGLKTYPNIKKAATYLRNNYDDIMRARKNSLKTSRDTSASSESLLQQSLRLIANRSNSSKEMSSNGIATFYFCSPEALNTSEHVSSLNSGETKCRMRSRLRVRVTKVDEVLVHLNESIRAKIVQQEIKHLSSHISFSEKFSSSSIHCTLSNAHKPSRQGEHSGGNVVTNSQSRNCEDAKDLSGIGGRSTICSVKDDSGDVADKQDDTAVIVSAQQMGDTEGEGGSDNEGGPGDEGVWDVEQYSNSISYVNESERPPSSYALLIPWNDEYILPLIGIAVQHLFEARQNRAGPVELALEQCADDMPEEFTWENNDETIQKIINITRIFKKSNGEMYLSRLPEIRHIHKTFLFNAVKEAVMKVYALDDDPGSSVWMKDVFNKRRNKMIILWRGGSAPESVDLLQSIVENELRNRRRVLQSDKSRARIRSPLQEWFYQKQVDHVGRLIVDEFSQDDSLANMFTALQNSMIKHWSEWVLDQLLDELVTSVTG